MRAVYFLLESSDVLFVHVHFTEILVGSVTEAGLTFVVWCSTFKCWKSKHFDVQMSNVKTVWRLTFTSFWLSTFECRTSKQFDVRHSYHFDFGHSNVKSQKSLTFISFWLWTFECQKSKEFDVQHSNVERQTVLTFDIWMSNVKMFWLWTFECRTSNDEHLYHFDFHHSDDERQAFGFHFDFHSNITLNLTSNLNLTFIWLRASHWLWLLIWILLTSFWPWPWPRTLVWHSSGHDIDLGTYFDFHLPWPWPSIFLSSDLDLNNDFHTTMTLTSSSVFSLICILIDLDLKFFILTFIQLWHWP